MTNPEKLNLDKLEGKRLVVFGIIFTVIIAAIYISSEFYIPKEFKYVMLENS